ncbi:MAG: hypothetical protein Q9214_000588 [Letrouitia sp. 1 TL-2023]
MVSVASLLNPTPSEQLPSPCSTLCSPEPFSRYLPVKKQKLCKDEAVFIKGKPKGNIQYWPCEDDDEDIVAEHKKYEIFPKGHIAEYCKHIPYNSEKKSFLLKTGREGFQGRENIVIDKFNDPETDLAIVFQYTFKMPHTEKKHVVMWDYNIGLVRITPFFKALDHPKTAPAKMLGKNPGLKEICYSITGGALAAQGYWMPFGAAKAVAATFCYRIRHALTPIFGIDFPSQCIKPGNNGFESMEISSSIIQQCIEKSKCYGALSRESSEAESPRTPLSTNHSRWTSVNNRKKAAKGMESPSDHGTDTDDSASYNYKLCKPGSRRSRGLHTPRSFPLGHMGHTSRERGIFDQFQYDSESSGASSWEGGVKRKRYLTEQDEANDGDDDMESPSPIKTSHQTARVTSSQYWNIGTSTQAIMDSIQNGPVAQGMRQEGAKTSSEFRNLANARVPSGKATANGQPLTHYHSFFYNLLSWENPRATTVSFISTVLFIFAARYLPALRWIFKILYITLGITAAAELGGKMLLSRGLASSFRPKKYYTIPRESLEASLEDVEQLINFFVIEFQRVLFAEKPPQTIAAFVVSFICYWLIKFTPLWGLSLIAACGIYLGPLIYITNQEIIDEYLQNATDVVNAQASQIRDLAGHHTSRATETMKAYAGDYTSKAQSYIGSPRSGSTSPVASPKRTKSGSIGTAGPRSNPAYTSADFPHAPKQEPASGVTSHQEQYETSQFGGKAEPAY